MGDTLGALLHSLHITSPVVSMCVFLQERKKGRLRENIEHSRWTSGHRTFVGALGFVFLRTVVKYTWQVHQLPTNNCHGIVFPLEN